MVPHLLSEREIFSGVGVELGKFLADCPLLLNVSFNFSYFFGRSQASR